jgi:hypothetical protein
MLSVVGFSLVVGPSGDETRQGQAKPRQGKARQGKARQNQTRTI